MLTESQDNSESLRSPRGALKLEKIEGPTTSLGFLGILINTTKWNCVSLMENYVNLEASCNVNGRRTIEVLNRSATPSVMLHTDASESWGCGAFWMKTGRWIQCQWPQQ